MPRRAAGLSCVVFHDVAVQRPAPPGRPGAARFASPPRKRLPSNPWLHYARRACTRAELILKNILEPLALPATGGFTVALVVFVLVCQLLGIGHAAARRDE